MENINKYFAILESLNYKKSDLNKLNSNISLIKKYLQVDLNKICKNLHVPPPPSKDQEWEYFCLLYHTLNTIKSEINFNSNAREDLVSLKNIDVFTKGVIEASKYGIRCHLLPEMQNHQIFENTKISKICNYFHLQCGAVFIKEIFEINIIASSTSINSVKLDAMAVAICLFTRRCASPCDKQISQHLLNFLWNNTCKMNYFRNLLILKSIQQLPLEVQSFLHENLLNKLQENTGFAILLDSMLPQNLLNVPHWKVYEVVSNIIAHKGHSNEFYENLTIQIFQFIKNCAGNDKLKNITPAGVLTLRKLYLLNNELKNNIIEKFDNYFKILINPEVVLTGVIIMDDEEFKLFVDVLSFMFCGSSMQSMPSEILINYLPILIQLYSQLQVNSILKGKVKNLIIQCIYNREKQELKEIISNLIRKNNLKKLHNRLSVKYNEKLETYSIQICPQESTENFEISFIITEILKTSNNNILIYNSFIAILTLLEEENDFTTNENTVELLQDEIELDEFLKRKFQLRISIIHSLTDLISFKQFHSQFQENPREILDFIKKSIKKRIETNSTEGSDENISIILALFQEILESSKDVDEFKSFIYLLKSLHIKSTNLPIKNQIGNLIYLIENGCAKRNDIFENSQYNFARSLIEESQSHLRVYGICLMIKLIKNKDEETLINRHAVLALALFALRDEESYTFLNCIKLFVALINIMEGEVLEMLTDEYLNDNEKIDFRLKIGEAILKVTEDLGELSYKYKNIFINCFLNGCRHQLDEFRCSSLSNLATICHLLTYQVHNFFQELLQLITSILETEKYLPAKRAVVLLISQLLCGMDNLVDFQEYLLPIYRLLKFIEQNSQDPIMRVHATDGLTFLSEKCKEFLLTDQKTEKEIQIFGIKDNINSKSKKNTHILQLN